MAINDDERKAIIVQGDTKLLIEKSRKLGEHLAQGTEKEKLSTSQIRSIFGTVKKIEARGFDSKGERDLMMLIPKLAYAAKRAGDRNKLADLREELTKAIELVTNGPEDKNQKFEHFCDFFEAILCYHKASGGK
jgi:CRISPR-associated protein Csm2